MKRPGELDDTLVEGGPPSDDTVVLPKTPRSASTTTESLPTSIGSGSDDAVVRYRIEGLIGRGGMGEVMSARDEQIGRSVAIKRMHGDARAATATTRFLREARIQGRLEHPAVVPVHELWHDARGNPFFVMKQLAGVTLLEVLEKIASGDPLACNQFSRQRLLRAFAEICLAIEFAHTRGVVHRDLKPANIMLGDFGEVYVLDWGIARIAGEATSRSSFADIETLEGGTTVEGSILGTPGYMSPEQVRGEAEIDGRSDVYALGCILFEIVTLTPAHERGRAALQSTLLGIEIRPSVRVPDREIPPELDAICLAATMLDRDDRYATARELGDAVQRFLDGDRDLALRKQLANAELAAARAALERGNGTVERHTAIRAAARALALDPTSRESADLVGRLMLEPPAEVPREVEDAIETLENDALYARRKLIIASALAMLGFLPLLFAAGFREPWYLITLAAAAAGMGVCGLIATPSSMVMFARVGLVCMVVSIAVYARISSPFFIAPGIAVVTAYTMATHRNLARPWVFIIIYSLAVLVPWLLEVSGVMSETMEIVGNTIILHGDATVVDPVIITTSLVVYTVLIITFAVALSATMANGQRAAQRVIQTHAWQLRQLMPRAS